MLDVQQVESSRIMGELKYHLLAEEILRTMEMPIIFPYRRAFLLGFVEGLSQKNKNKEINNLNIT